VKNNLFLFFLACFNNNKVSYSKLAEKICLPMIPAIVVLFFFSGCNKPETKTTEPVKKSIVVFSNAFGKPSENDDLVDKIFDPLGEEMGIKIDFLRIEGVEGLKDMEARSDQYRVSADIELGPFGTMVKMIDEGYLVDLSKATKFWSEIDVLPAFRNGVTARERKYFMPIIGNIYILIANKKALPYIPKGVDINNLTWEQFADWAINMKKVNGYGRTVLSGVSLNSFIYQFGACALSYGAGFPDINSEGAKKAWGIFEKIASSNAFVPNIRIVGDCTDVMQTHQAWLSILNNTKACEVYALDPESFVLASMPKGSAGRGTIVGFSGMGVMKNSRNLKMALKILEHFSEPKVQIKVARETGGFFPASLGALKYLDTKNPKDIVIRKAINELNSNIIIANMPSQDYVKWEVVQQLFDNIFQNVILSKKPMTNDTLNAAAKELKLLKK